MFDTTVTPTLADPCLRHQEDTAVPNPEGDTGSGPDSSHPASPVLPIPSGWFASIRYFSSAAHPVAVQPTKDLPQYTTPPPPARVPVFAWIWGKSLVLAYRAAALFNLTSRTRSNHMPHPVHYAEQKLNGLLSRLHNGGTSFPLTSEIENALVHSASWHMKILRNPVSVL